MIRLVIALALLVLTAQTRLGFSVSARQVGDAGAALEAGAAVKVVHAINHGSSDDRRAPDSGYRPLEELLNIPPLPPGFDLQFLTDGEGYMVSIKDTLDPCRYAVFSGPDTRGYEALPQVSPRALPVVSGR